MKPFRLILLLLFFILLFFSLKALFSLEEYKNRVDSNITINFDRFYFFLKDTLKKEYIKFTAPSPLSNRESKLKTFYITLKQSDIAKLNSNLPYSGKENYIKGYLKISDDKELKKIKLRYRGDTNLHWNYTQKSLKIKLAKNQTYKMQKSINLLNPPHDFSIIDCVAYDISRELGLLSPRYEPVRVFINSQFMGVYIFLTQIDESFLRINRRMPGSIYYGDLTNRDMISPNTPAELFYNPNLWVKKASRNREQKYNREDIDYFISKINSSEKEFYSFAKNYLNLPKYYTFFALDTLFGSFHHDYAHNHKLYFDPYIGKFEPIQWDLRYWSAIGAKDISLYPLINRFKLNPILEAKRDRAAYEILKKYPAKEINRRLDYYKELILPDLKRDIYRDTGVRDRLFPKGIAKSFTIKEFKESISKYKEAILNREKYLYKLYNSTKLFFSYKKLDNGEYNITIEIDGNSPVIFNNHILYPARKFIPSNPLGAVPFLYGDRELISSPFYYSFLLKDKTLSSYTFINYITREKITPIYKEDIKIVKDYNSSNPNIFKPNRENITILSGDINVTNDLIFNGTVKILPNTTFTISKGKSIFFYGKVLANGEKDRPITFKSKEPLNPFGVVAVQGGKASNSIFNYIVVQNGTSKKENLIDYTAPFNIYSVNNFKITNSTFNKNSIGDDLVHIAYSKGIVKNSIFKNAKSDGLDIDIGDIKIFNSIFKNCGNDGVDIMTTKLIAVNNKLIDTGDKGISIGEWSDANLTNNLFIRNRIAIEVKDQSLLNLKDTTIKDSNYKAINLYHKNHRYDRGGTALIENLKIEGNKIITTDKKSTIRYKNEHSKK